MLAVDLKQWGMKNGIIKGSESLSHIQIGLLKVFISNFPTSIPVTFYMEVIPNPNAPPLNPPGFFFTKDWLGKSTLK